MVEVGFSTGDLYESKLSLDEVIKRCSSVGAEAIELNFGSSKLLLEHELNEDSKEALRNFSYLSVHAPFVKAEYGDNEETKVIINELKELHEEFNVDGVVVHPNDVEDFEVLEETDLPFLIENMDPRKKEGKEPSYFEELKDEYSFEFVFDVEHAYENDESMDLAFEMIEVMGSRLKHMHVSGCRGDRNHVPVYDSENRREIGKVLKEGLDVPKILEGVLRGNLKEAMTKELSYVRNYEV